MLLQFAPKASFFKIGFRIIWYRFIWYHTKHILIWLHETNLKNMTLILSCGVWKFILWYMTPKFITIKILFSVRPRMEITQTRHYRMSTEQNGRWQNSNQTIKRSSKSFQKSKNLQRKRTLSQFWPGRFDRHARRCTTIDPSETRFVLLL